MDADVTLRASPRTWMPVRSPSTRRMSRDFPGDGGQRALPPPDRSRSRAASRSRAWTQPRVWIHSRKPGPRPGGQGGRARPLALSALSRWDVASTWIQIRTTRNRKKPRLSSRCSGPPDDQRVLSGHRGQGRVAHAAAGVAGVVVADPDRAALERLCPYGARPGFAHDRLRWTSDGRISYRLKRPWPDGRTHLVLEPVAFLRRLIGIIPPRRRHLIRYAGVWRLGHNRQNRGPRKIGNGARQDG